MEGAELSIRIRQSRLLITLLGVLHCLAIAALAGVDVPGTLRMTLGFLAAASLARVVIASRRESSDVAVRYFSGQWSVAGRRARLMGDSSLMPGLVILRLRTDNGMRTLCILPDSADAGARRRLRVLLRHGARTVSSASALTSG